MKSLGTDFHFSFSDCSYCSDYSDCHLEYYNYDYSDYYNYDYSDYYYTHTTTRTKMLLTTQLIGLTGGIASGKSTCVRYLRGSDELSVAVVDADHIARLVVEPGRPAYHQIVRHFGRRILVETTGDGDGGGGGRCLRRRRRGGGVGLVSLVSVCLSVCLSVCYHLHIMIDDLAMIYAVSRCLLCQNVLSPGAAMRASRPGTHIHSR